MTIAPAALPDEPAALKRIITAMAQDAVNAQAEIAMLKFQLARYRRAEFGRSSEKLARETAQLELVIETLESDQAERRTMASPEGASWRRRECARGAKAGPPAIAWSSAARRGADSDGSRPGFRDDLARHSDLMSLAVPR